MKKRILLTIVAIAAVAVGVIGMSAYEAHVINVTAHIENALAVDTTSIHFGTVFPQEYIDNETFTVNLSSSFKGAERLDDVHYNIIQKPKPIWPKLTACTQTYVTIEEARAYCHDNSDDQDCCYLDLCSFLSKLNLEGDEDEGSGENDIDAPSYYVPAGENNNPPATCITPSEASGILSKVALDDSDSWTVDLKVPPVTGYVGQDWPANCPTVSKDNQDYGCDLWVEVTGFSTKPVCGNGIKENGEECDDGNKTSGDGCSDQCKVE